MPAEDSEMQRRHSSATETSALHGTDGGLNRHTSNENVELIPTRTTKVATSKPAANPLQFIKVGPCNLYRSAQEQLKKVEEVKKVKKEVRDDAEDWQSNLDNWKCSRRKKQEHIIERVVEVKKLEFEEHDRNRRRSKTFSEMMEERNSRGRKLSLPLYQDDDNNDLSDLGISSRSSTSSTITEEAQFKDDESVKSQESDVSTNQNSCVNQNGTSYNGHKDEDSSKTSSETEEYTYERAIQSYVNYAETRGKSRNLRSSSEENNYSASNGHISRKSPSVPAKPRRGSTPKIEEKMSELEQLKKRSMSTTDLSTGELNRKSILVPKVDINKRRELFEKMPGQEEQSSKLNHRLSGDFSSSKSIRERLSSLGKQVEESPSKRTINRLSSEVSVKDRLSSIEKFRSTENLSTTGKISKATSENVLNAPSVRDRLNTLESSVHKEVKSSGSSTEKLIMKNEKEESAEDSTVEIFNYATDSASNTISEFKNDSTSVLDKNQSGTVDSFKSSEVEDHLERTSSPEEEIYENTRQQHYRHRSLDSLDIDSAENLNSDCFGRVQSLEDLDFCRNYPASSLSGDTDREDSGIHTADVSSSVSQADDCDSHLDSSSVDTEFKFQHHPTIIEEISRKTDSGISSCSVESSVSKNHETKIGVSCSDDCSLEVAVVTSSDSSSSTSASSSSSNSSLSISSLKLPLRTDHNDPLPVIPECPSEPVTPSDILVSLVASDEGKGVADVNTIISPASNANSFVLNEISKENENSICEVSTKDDESPPSSNIDDTGNKDIDTNYFQTNDLVVENDNNCNINTNNNSADSNLNSFNDVNNETVSAVESDTVNSSLNNVNKVDNGLVLDCSIKLVEDTSSSFSDSSDNKTDIKLDDNKILNGNGDNLTVCMQEKRDGSSVDNKNHRRQTVIEICEKIDSADLSSSLSTPVISVDSFNFNTEKVEKDSTICNQEIEESIEHVPKSLTRKDSNNVNNNNHCLKTDIILNEKNEIYNDSEKCHQMIMNKIDFSPQDSVIINNSEIVQDNDINLNILPVVSERSNFYLDKSNKLPQLNIHQEVEGEIIFPLSPSILEPPKEKPPPPPSELSDDDDSITPAAKPSSLRRLDSTKRIKKEIRQKRSSFLGIEGGNDDSLEPELDIQPPPDMTSFLQEERRLEQMMYRQSICSESDSNQGESRDSGVELDRSHHDDISWPNHNHSRHDSEIFGNASTTSEEEENIKKEREIIDIMKQNDQQSYINNAQDQENIGEKLALRLRELEAEKSRLEWEREEEINRRKAEEAARCHQESLIQAREEELRKQETVVCSTEEVSLGDSKQHFTGEMLMSERERLEREQEELTRQRETLLLQQQWAASLQDVSQQTVNPTESTLYNSNNHDYRRSMPNLQQEPPPRHTRPPPPIPPAKPLIMPRESLRQQDKPVKRTSSPQQMSRQTLQALSAAPRSRLISTDTWIQTKRKPKQENYNYQHWLIQEAEHRRITEQQQRQATVPPRRPAPPHPSAYPGQQYVATGRETGWQQSPNCQPQKQPTPSQQQWATSPSAQPLPQGAQWVPGSGVPSRSDKPLPDSIIQTLTQRVQNRIINNPDSSHTTNNNSLAINCRRRPDVGVVSQTVDPQHRVAVQQQQVRIDPQHHLVQQAKQQQQQQQQHQEKMLSVSGKKKCSHCGEELGRGAAMIIETLRLFYHIDCFKCCVCCVQLGDGLMGTDVRVRNNKLHCQNCYSSDDGVKFSCV